MTAPNLEGMARVFSGPKHEVYCDGSRRAWVPRFPVERERVAYASPCPNCRPGCSAFGMPKGGHR